MSELVDLEQGLAALTPKIDGTYVFHTLESVPEGISFFAQIREDEGITLVTTPEEAKRLGLPAAPQFALISLGAFTSLDAVGITATVAQTMASREIPCNVIAGFHHDHLFVPQARSAEAVRLLESLSMQAAGWLKSKGLQLD